MSSAFSMMRFNTGDCAGAKEQVQMLCQGPRCRRGADVQRRWCRGAPGAAEEVQVQRWSREGASVKWCRNRGADIEVLRRC